MTGAREVFGACVRCVQRINCKVTTRVVCGQVPPTRSLVVHGGRGCWVVRHADATVTTEAADWITTHYEQVPPADADAHALTNRIVEQWQHDRCKADGFQIASEEELFGYLLRIFTRRRA